MKKADKIIQDLWREKVVRRISELDPDDEYTWQDVWAGFVAALDRPDLATYEAYDKIGFPVGVEQRKS